MTKRLHVAIVGAGFGGLGVADQLARTPVDVTLIDRHNYHTFQPLLYQVATSLLNAEDVGAPVRGMFQHKDNINFRMATVEGVDIADQKIRMEDGKEISYDYLVLAGGTTVNYFNTPGAAEHAFPLYTLMNAVKLRNRILERFEAVDRDPGLIHDGALNFVIVGAGPPALRPLALSQTCSTTFYPATTTNWLLKTRESFLWRWDKRCSLRSTISCGHTLKSSLRNEVLKCVWAKLSRRLVPPSCA
jgi:hypothetical protein